MLGIGVHSSQWVSRPSRCVRTGWAAPWTSESRVFRPTPLGDPARDVLRCIACRRLQFGTTWTDLGQVRKHASAVR